jgi:hypothetical protein
MRVPGQNSYEEEKGKWRAPVNTVGTFGFNKMRGISQLAKEL